MKPGARFVATLSALLVVGGAATLIFAPDPGGEGGPSAPLAPTRTAPAPAPAWVRSAARKEDWLREIEPAGEEAVAAAREALAATGLRLAASVGAWLRRAPDVPSPGAVRIEAVRYARAEPMRTSVRLDARPGDPSGVLLELEVERSFGPPLHHSIRVRDGAVQSWQVRDEAGRNGPLPMGSLSASPLAFGDVFLEDVLALRRAFAAPGELSVVGRRRPDGGPACVVLELAVADVSSREEPGAEEDYRARAHSAWIEAPIAVGALPLRRFLVFDAAGRLVRRYERLVLERAPDGGQRIAFRVRSDPRESHSEVRIELPRPGAPPSDG